MFASAYFRENVHFYSNYHIPLIRTVSIITVFAMIIVQLTMQCPIAKKDLIKDSSNRQSSVFNLLFLSFISYMTGTGGGWSLHSQGRQDQVAAECSRHKYAFHFQIFPLRLKSPGRNLIHGSIIFWT